MRKRKVPLPQVSLGAVVRENLPLPVVYYPRHYGTFFAFAESANAPPVLCACSMPAVENLLKLNEGLPPLRHDDPLKSAPLDNRRFPDVLAELSLRHRGNPMSVVRFERGLCHRCNLVAPTLRYCHEMYGGQFMQYYGWYVKQAYFRFGIAPSPFGSYRYLPDVCPMEYQRDIRSLEAAKMDYMSELERVENIVTGPPRQDIPPDEVVYWQNVRIEEAQPMIELRRRAAQTERAFTKKIENIVRQEFGFGKVGEGWMSETMLLHIVEQLFPTEQVLHHFRPDYLKGMELDIYVPSRQLAFEYQGQQHFHPIKAWGGKKALEQVKVRDARKGELCEEHGVKLLTVDYTEPLTEAHVRDILSQEIA